MLTALAFSLGALGRAHDIPVSALFRDTVEPATRRMRPRYAVAVLAAALALAGVTVLFATDRRIALIYVGRDRHRVRAAARRRARPHGRSHVPHRGPRAVELRLALANVHRPGALTPSVVLSLGLGLALLVTLTLIDVNIRGQLHHTAPGKTPSFFFIDIPSRTAPDFTSFLKSHAPDATLDQVPMMRGRVTALKGEPVEKAKASEDAAWVLEGDRGITFAETVPQGSTLVSGDWWPKDYAGPPLVSFEDKLAKGLGLTIGDTVSVNVLGRTVTARIANLRQVDWESFGINFVMVFSPNTFRGAPYMVLATAAFPDGEQHRAGADAAQGRGRGVPDHHRRAGQGCARRHWRSCGAPRARHPRRVQRRNRGLDSGARRRGRGGAAHAGLRGCGAQGARRHASAAARRLCDRIRRDRPRDGRVRRSGGDWRRLVHRARVS